MSAIPLHDLDEVVTKADLRAEAAGLRAEIAELRLEVKGEFARLESRIELERLQRRLKLLTTAVPVSTFAAILAVGILT